MPAEFHLLSLVADEITDNKTCASDIFYDFKVMNRPAVVPPYTINGGSADTGGVHNLFEEGEEPEENHLPTGVADEDDDDDDGDEDGEEEGVAGNEENEPPQPENWQDDPLQDGPPGQEREYPSSRSTGGTAQKPKPTKSPKGLNLGGSGKRKRAPPKNNAMIAANAMIEAMKEFRDADRQLEQKREQEAKAERAAAREHEMKMLQLIMRAGGGGSGD